MTEITKEEAKKRTQISNVMPPTTDQAAAEGIKALGETLGPRAMTNLRDEEAVILALGLAATEDKPEDLLLGFFVNMAVLSIGRSAMGRKQVTEVAKAYGVGAGTEGEKQGRWRRFVNAIGMGGD